MRKVLCIHSPMGFNQSRLSDGQAWKVMRLIFIFLFAACMQVCATGYTQQVSLQERNAKLEDVFHVLKKQTGLPVLYTRSMLKDTRRITVNLQNVSLTVALDEILKDQGLAYSIINNTIVIKVKDAVDPKDASTSPSTVQTTIDVSGKVTDADGNALAGASVKVKGTTIGTTTDASGVFMLKGIDENAILVFSYTEHETVELKVGGRTSVSVGLKKIETSLQEVVINKGYYTEKQRLSTSNVSTVTAKDIEKQPVNNPLLALQGRVPGLVVQQANGIPGGGVTVRIQGRNNLDNTLVGSDPLIVIDGVPYQSQNLQTFKGGSTSAPILGSSSKDGFVSAENYGNPLAYINPADIESITVLKDADATAIYGSRAANGALIITTKKGKAGKMKVDINLQQGWGQVAKKMKLLNNKQYMEMRWEGKYNDGESVNPTDYDLRGVWDTTRNTDWQKELIGGTAQFQRLTAGISGGTNNIQYFISGTYGRETTVFPGDFSNKSGSIHYNISASSPNQRLKIQFGGSYMNNVSHLPAEDFTYEALNMPPVAPALFNQDGSLNWAPDPATGTSTWWNPLSRLQYLFETKTNNLIANGLLSYRILPGLELKSTFGFTSTTSDQFIAALDGSELPELRENRFRDATFSYNTSRSWIVEPQLTFQKNYRKHTLSVLAGSTFQSQNNDGRGFQSYGQSTDLLLRNMLGGTQLVPSGTDQNEYRYNGIFGRIGYSFKEKYVMNITGRRDGSSRFGPNSQFNNFGAVGVGWLISEEEFFQNNVPFISFAKLRGSYGSSGNDQIGNYRFLYLFDPNNPSIPYQGLGGLSPTGLSNPDLEWEETRKLQAGIDLGLLSDRIFITVNFFRNRTSNSLTNIIEPIITGFNRKIANLDALVQNKGWEFSVNSSNIKGKNFHWNSAINLTIPQNKLLAFPDLENSSLKQYMVIGQPLTIGRTYPYYGVDQQTGLYVVLNKQGQPTTSPTSDDQTVFLNMNPRWYGGILNSFKWNGFTMDFLIQFTKQKGDDVLQFGYPGYFTVLDYSTVLGNQPASVMDRWQRPGDMASYQRFSSTGNIASIPSGSIGFRDLSFMRMKNLSISYQLSANLLQKIRLENLRVYMNAQNLFTITKYKGFDPETQNINSLPPLRVITFGVQATF